MSILWHGWVLLLKIIAKVFIFIFKFDFLQFDWKADYDNGLSKDLNAEEMEIDFLTFKRYESPIWQYGISYETYAC